MEQQPQQPNLDRTNFQSELRLEPTISKHQQTATWLRPGMTCKSSAPSPTSAKTTTQHHRHIHPNGEKAIQEGEDDSNFSITQFPVTMPKVLGPSTQQAFNILVGAGNTSTSLSREQGASLNYYLSFFSRLAAVAKPTTVTARSKSQQSISQQQPHLCLQQQNLPQARRKFQQHYRHSRSGVSLYLLTTTFGVLFLAMMSRHVTAIPAPAPEPAPAPQTPEQPTAAAPPPQQQKAADPPASPPSAPAPASPPASNPPPTTEKAGAKPNDPPAPVNAIAADPPQSPPATTPAQIPTSSLSPSSSHVPSSPVVAPVSPPHIVSPAVSSTESAMTSTPLSPTHSPTTSSSKGHHTSIHINQQPSGTPYGVISENSNGNESSNRIMLTVSLVVVFVILAGMGLVVYCLFRRRSAKRRMHLFGTGGSKSTTNGSLDSSVAANGGSGIGGGKRKSYSGNRRSSIKSLGGGGDPIVTALAEMQEQQRRISDVDMSRALQAMTEQHQNAMISRRSSTLSLGGLHHHSHHQHFQQQQQHPGSRIVSPTLGPSRPHSSMAVEYWNGAHGTGVDVAGQVSRRQSMSGIVIGSGEYVAGPLESSPDFRTTAYDDLYYPSRQFLYPSSSGTNSSGANSNEQLLPPHHHGHRQYYSSGTPSSANMSRRSSLSPGAYPANSGEMPNNGKNPSLIMRAKTNSASSGNNHQQQMHCPQNYPPSTYRSTPHTHSPHSSTPPPLGPGLQTPSQFPVKSVPTPATVGSSSGDSSDSTSDYPSSSTPGTDSQKGHVEGAGVGTGSRSTTDLTGIPRSTSPLGDSSLEHPHLPANTIMRPHSMSMLQQGPSPSPYYNGSIPGERTRSPPPMMSSSTGNLLDHQRASYDGGSGIAIPPSITTRRRSMMPSGPTSPTGYFPYQQHQQVYGGQEYYQEDPSARQQHTSGPSRFVSPYGYGNPYQDHQHHQHQYNGYQHQQQAVDRRSSTHLGQGKTDLVQEGAGVGTGTSSSSTSSSTSLPYSGGASVAPIPSKSPPPNPSGSWPGRSHSNVHGPIVHVAPAPTSSMSRASATAAAAGLSIVTPIDNVSGLRSMATSPQQTEILNSPTDSSAP